MSDRLSKKEEDTFTTGHLIVLVIFGLILPLSILLISLPDKSESLSLEKEDRIIKIQGNVETYTYIEKQAKAELGRDVVVKGLIRDGTVAELVDLETKEVMYVMVRVKENKHTLTYDFY